MKKRKSVVVIGLGGFGLSLVKKLKELNADVTAIDKDPAAAKIAENIADRTFICDGGNFDALEEIGVDKVDHAIVAISQGNPSSVVSTITATLALKKMNIKDSMKDTKNP